MPVLRSPGGRVEGGHGNRLGGIVDDQVNAGDGFQSPDVPAFAADDTALHLVVGQRDDADGNFCCMVGSTALDGSGDDLTGLVLCLVLQLLLDLLDLHGSLVTDFVLNALEQVSLCLFLGQLGDLFQSLQLLSLDGLSLSLGLGDLGQFLGQFLFLALEGFGLLVESGFFLFQTALLLGKLGATLFYFLVVFCA